MNYLNQETNDYDMGWFFKIATSDNKRFVTSSNLHEFRHVILGDYT